MLNVDWNKFKYFYLAVQFGKIKKAAESLSMSQSTLSRHISTLEQDLGFELLVRSIAGVKLTVKGEAVYNQIKDSFFQIEKIYDAVSDLETLPKGNLIVAADIGLIETWFNNYLSDFLITYPDIKLTINARENLNTIMKEGADIVCSIVHPDSETFSYESLMKWHRVLFASPDYLKKYGVPQTVEDLDQHRLIAFGESSVFSGEDINWHLQLGRSVGNPREPYLSINSLAGTLNAAKHDLGIVSFSQESLLLKGSNLIRILPEITGPTLEVFMIMVRENQSIARFQAFRNFFKEKARELSPYNS